MHIGERPAPPQDADGYLYVTDRKKDMIISGGSNPYGKVLKRELRDRYWAGRERKV